jgi:hypothetical protein
VRRRRSPRSGSWWCPTGCGSIAAQTPLSKPRFGSRPSGPSRKARKAKTFYETRSLFSEMDRKAEPYVYEEQFHNQLKARLLNAMVLTQIVKESTLCNIRKPTDSDFDARAAARQSELAWNLCTAIFHKVGGRPWKVAGTMDWNYERVSGIRNRWSLVRNPSRLIPRISAA